MTAYSDEILSGYVDGELEPGLMAEIETAAQADADLAMRITTARAHDAILREAFDEALAGAAPDFLSVVLPSDNVVPFAKRAQPKTTPRWIPSAIAASVAFAVGAYAMYGFTSPSGVVSASRGGLVADASIASALSAAPSGENTAISGGTMKVALSFKASDQRLCREFALNYASAGAMGVACRDDGVWRIEAITAAPKSHGDFQTAGGPDDSALAPVMKRLGVGAPLDAAGENAAIRAGWKR